VAEMALAGGIGAEVTIETRGLAGLAADAFGETQGLYVITTTDSHALKGRAKDAGVDIDWIGSTGGKGLRFRRFSAGQCNYEVSLADLRAAHEGFFPRLMGNELTPEF